MSMISYVKQLSARFNKNDIQKNCEITADSLKTHTIPGYVAASETFKTFQLRNKEILSYNTEFRKLCSVPRSGTIIDSISEALGNGVVLLDYLHKHSDTLYSEQESSLGLTYRKATYLRLISTITFAGDYARKFLNYVYTLETQSADEQFQIKDNITPAEIAFVKSNFLDFCNAIKILQQSVEQITKNVDNLPDAIVSESSDAAFSGTLGQAKMDPMGFSNFSMPVQVSVKWNPFYHIGAMIASFQVAQYKCAKEETDLLALRRLNLEKVLAKKPDARLQKEIEHLSSRISGLNYELSKMEKKNA